MKVGDLVKVVQRLGCHVPTKHFHDRGLGVILSIAKSEPIRFPSVGEVLVQDEVTVALTTGEVCVFFPESIAVVNESR